MQDQRYPCPCCGYLVFLLEPGHHETCAICGWEDDLSQLRFVQMPGSANPLSLAEAQSNFLAYGASSRRVTGHVREADADDYRDPAWRPLDLARDNVEHPRSGVRYGDSYPWEDPTVLYYWRPTYWRRLAS